MTVYSIGVIEYRTKSMVLELIEEQSHHKHYHDWKQTWIMHVIWTRRYLSRVSILTRDIDIANLSVCDVPVSDENGLTYRHSFFYRTIAQSF